MLFSVLIITIFLLYTIIMCYISKTISGTLSNPITFINVWWSFWVTISTFGLLNLYVPEIKTYIFVLITLFFHSIGCLLVLNKNEAKNPKIYVSKTKMKFFSFLSLLILIVVSIFFVIQLPLIISIPFSTLRTEGGIPELFYGMSLIIDLTIYPLLLTTTLISISGYLLKQMKPLNISINLVSLALIGIIKAARMPIFFGFMFFVIGLLLLKENNVYPKIKTVYRIFQYNLKIMVLPIIVMIFVSFHRSSRDALWEIIVNYIVVYFTGPLIALNKFLNEVYNNVLSFDYMCGRATLAGLEHIVALLLNLFYDIEYSIFFIQGYVEERFLIGFDRTYNAFYSMIYYFFLDGGFVGVVLLSILTGIIVGLVFNYYKNKPSIFSLSLCIFLISNISIFSLLRWQFVRHYSFIVIILLFLLLKIKWTFQTRNPYP